MTVRAVCIPQAVLNTVTDPSTTIGDYSILLTYVGCDTSNLVDSSLAVRNITPSTIQADVKTIIKNAVQSDLTINHSYVFVAGDEVKVLGWT